MAGRDFQHETAGEGVGSGVAGVGAGTDESPPSPLLLQARLKNVLHEPCFFVGSSPVKELLFIQQEWYCGHDEKL
jgi:hypothetical protein